MSTSRREFLARAIATVTAAGVGVATGLWHHRSTKPAAEPKPEPVNVEGELTVTYTGPFATADLEVYCVEINNDPGMPRREMQWTMQDAFDIPEIGTTFQIERVFSDENIETERFSMEIVRVREIR